MTANITIGSQVAFWSGWDGDGEEHGNPATWTATGTVVGGTPAGWAVELDEPGVGDDVVTFPESDLRLA